MKRATRRDLTRPGAWTFTPLAVLKSRDISQGAKSAYMALASFVRSSDQSEVCESEHRLAETYGASARTFRRHAAELKAAEFITVEERPGRPSVYIFLQPEIEGQQALFDQAPRTQPAREIRKPRPKPAGPPRTKPARPTGPLPYTPSGEGLRKQKSDINAATTKLDRDSERLGAGQEPGQRGRLAAAFLSRYFSRKSAEKLLRKHGPAKVLFAARQLQVRQEPAKIPPALIRHILTEPADQARVEADANEVEGKALKADLDAQDKAIRKKTADNKKKIDLHTWLGKQPDKDEIMVRAKNDAKFRNAGKALSFRALRTSVDKFLRKERQRRDLQENAKMAQL